MEAFAIMSLFGSIIQVIEAGDGIIKAAKDVRQSSFGTTLESERLQESASELRQLSMRIEPLPTCHLSPDQEALQRLTQECRRFSEKMLKLARNISDKRFSSTLGAFFAACTDYNSRKSLKTLEEQLHMCWIELQLQYRYILR